MMIHHLMQRVLCQFVSVILLVPTGIDLRKWVGLVNFMDILQHCFVH
jgi:hypothetical protein